MTTTMAMNPTVYFMLVYFGASLEETSNLLKHWPTLAADGTKYIATGDLYERMNMAALEADDFLFAPSRPFCPSEYAWDRRAPALLLRHAPR